MNILEEVRKLVGEQSKTYELTVQYVERYDELEQPKIELPTGFGSFYKRPNVVVAFNPNVPGTQNDVNFAILDGSFPDAKPGDVFTVVVTKQIAS